MSSTTINPPAESPLGREPIPRLLFRFAVPSIIAMLTSALYNIVDQFFIGHSVGELGNAATNVSFPLSTCCTAVALLLGIGGASAFNLAKGRGEHEEAEYYMGNALVGMLSLGIILTIMSQLFLEPMLILFGSPAAILPYASTYVRITSLGFPMLILTVGGGHLVRADGMPRFSMLCNMTGAIVNTILDALFVFGFSMGMAGAALATIIGQYISACMIFYYYRRLSRVNLTPGKLCPRRRFLLRVMTLGMAPCFNQLAMMVVQLVMNKSLTYYGALSSYGESIPLACAGIISKVNMVFFSVVIGFSQGLQPIAGFNYGAQSFLRVKKAYLLTLRCGFSISLIAFLLFQLIPEPIIALFGDASPAYISFAARYFRCFLFFTCLNFLQPMTSNFFTAIGKPRKGVFLSLIRQIILLLPLILLLPISFGIDGILYAGPIADGLAALIVLCFALAELRRPEYKNK